MSTQEKKLIDDTFFIRKERFLWQTYDKEDNPLVSGLTEESCIQMTHFYLKGIQEGWPESDVTHSGTVGGKL
jgi:hypothetical protein